MSDTGPAVLVLDCLTVGYGRLPILRDIHLKFSPGSFTGLLGANGSGKSTLIRTLLGILPPLSGEIRFTPIHGHEPVLGYVPQRESLDPIYLVSSFEVVLMGVCGRVGAGRLIGRKEREWARHCLSETGADALGRRQFSELSGGQKQRVLIARALAAKPDFLLLDEPTSGIDPTVKRSIMDLLRRLQQDQRKTILMSSHDLPVVRECVEKVVWLHEGRIEQGPVSELLTQERMAALLDVQLH